MTEKTTSLTELVEKAAAGDKTAFQDIYNLKWREVHFFALQMTSDIDSAQDVAQEAFIKIFTNIGSLKEPAKFNVWMYKIVRNVINDMHNTGKDRIFDVSEDIDNYSNILEEESSEFLPEEFLEKQENREILLDIVKSLGEDYRMAILMFYYQQMSHDDISKVTGASIPAVKVRLMRARSFIKAKLEKLKEKGVTLQSMATLPILTIVFNDEADRAIAETVKSASWGEITSGLAAAGIVLADAAAKTAKAAATKMSIVAKAAIAVASTAAAVGVGVTAILVNKAPPKAPSESPPAIVANVSSTVSFQEDEIALSEDPPETSISEPPQESSAPPPVSSKVSTVTSVIVKPESVPASQPPASSAPSKVSSAPSSSATEEHPEPTLEYILGANKAKEFLGYIEKRSYQSKESFNAKERFGLESNIPVFIDFPGTDYYNIHSKFKGDYALYVCEVIRDSDETYDINYKIQKASDPYPYWDTWEFANR